MYKRQDWLHLHGQQAAEDSSSGSEDSQPEETGEDASESGSSDEEPVSDGEEKGDDDADAAADEAEDEPPTTRLEDLSEDDFDGGAESDDSDVVRMQEQLAEQKRSWLSTTKEEHRKGPPLTCLLCKGVLILNAEGLQSHLGSKRHQKLTKKLEDPVQDTIVYAQDLQEDSSDAETHQERAERVAAQAAAQKGGAESDKTGRKRKRFNAVQGKKRKGKKPGKRQRSAASRANGS